MKDDSVKSKHSETADWALGQVPEEGTQLEKDKSIKLMPEKKIWLCVAVMIGLGYFLYFLGVVFEKNSWIKFIIDMSHNYIGSIRTAANLSAINGVDTVVSRLILIYTSIGSLIFTIIFCLLYLLNKKPLIRLQKNKLTIARKNYSIYRIIIGSIFLITIAITCSIRLYWIEYNDISWRDYIFYSSSFYSCSFLIFSMITCVGIPHGILILYVSLFELE